MKKYELGAAHVGAIQAMKEMITLANSTITAQISEHGAELFSLVKGGRELLWTADKQYWGRHAPILFPIVGKVFGNRYRIGDAEFSLSQHGFARDSDFEVVSAEPQKCVLKLCSSESSRERYPFDFELVATYTLEEDGIVCSWEVRNAGKVDMPCQIGGHPAFNYVDWPQGDGRGSLMILKGGRPLGSFVATRISEGGCALPGLEKVELRDGMMKLDSRTFDNGVFILEDGQCDEMRLISEAGETYLTLESKSPVFGIWAPEHKNPPFMCIEPWMGRTDPEGYCGQFDHKPWINILAPGATLNFEYSLR